MSQRIPSELREVLEEILEGLQTAEPEAVAQANEKSESDSPFAYVAGYLGATIKCHADRLERLLTKDAPAEKGEDAMTAFDTARAHALVEAELGRIPEADRGEVASQVLGALTSHFMFIPHPTAREESATRADLAALNIPGFHDFISPTKGRT